MKYIKYIPALLIIFVLSFYKAPPLFEMRPDLPPVARVGVNVHVSSTDESRATRSIPKGVELPEIWACYGMRSFPNGNVTQLWARIGEAEWVKVKDENGVYILNACDDIPLTDPMPSHNPDGNA